MIPSMTEDQDLEGLISRPFLVKGKNHAFRLSGLAGISEEREAPVIERFNHQYKRYLDIPYLGPYELGEKILERELRSLRLPPGYSLKLEGDSFLNESVRRDLLLILLGTALFVFLVIAAVLESWKLAGLVSMSVPIAWIGVALGFLWTGESFAEGAFIGAVLTIGVAVNDSILLADRFRCLRLAHPSIRARLLILAAVRSRLHPMWTTAFSTLVGTIPMLVLAEAGSFWIGLALTVVGGLLSSTLLAPVAMVSLLSWKSRKKVALVLPAEAPLPAARPLLPAE